METIYDYLRKNKYYDLKEVPWNIMDTLFCAIISYMPVKSFNGIKSFEEILAEVRKENLEDKHEVMEKKSKELFAILDKSKRYKNMKFKNFINTVNNHTQFGALTCIIDNIKIISFKGSDKSIIGWLENLRLAYEYPTYTQKLAIKYLNDNISIFDKEVYVTGHSKGGNLAIASTMELDDFKFDKIKEIINFDGPGFKKEEFESLKYQKLSNKLINIMPKDSYVGVLMFNKNYRIINTNAKGISVHYLTNWLYKDNDLIDNKLSILSKELHTKTTSNVENLDLNIVKDIFETLFKTYDNRETDNIKLTLDDIKSLLESFKDLDSDTFKYIYTIVKEMLKITKGEDIK